MTNFKDPETKDPFKRFGPSVQKKVSTVPSRITGGVVIRRETCVSIRPESCVAIRPIAKAHFGEFEALYTSPCRSTRKK